MVSIKYTKEEVLSKLSHLQKLNYNKFFWWRRWTRYNQDLNPKSPLIDRILNGDFDFSHYYWQMEYCNIEIEEKRTQSEDLEHFHDVTKIDYQRRKRLREDYEKDESEKLSQLETEFLKNFNITKEQYEGEIEQCGGGLKDLYYQIFGKYEKRIQLPSKRGRKSKKK